MDARLIALVILLPFAVLFIYSGLHEYQRYKTEGRAKYGLAYDEESGTTHVTAIGEDEEGYDPNEFDPGDYSERDTDDETRGGT